MGRPEKQLEVGRRIGRLVILGAAKKIGRDAASMCRCDCGTEKAIRNPDINSGRRVSCGCYSREQASIRCKTNPPNLKHGGRGTITYNCWQGMLARCHKPSCSTYKNYGGRGIKVCDRWKDPSSGFLNFVKDMGNRPSKDYSIDRVNSDGDYHPSNCRWATRFEQNQNMGLKKTNTTGYKGISSSGSNWKTEIRSKGRKFHLGVYSSKEEAALAYNYASQILHGPFGVRNRIPKQDKQTKRKVLRKVKSILGE